jgi:predicted outer membrane repeat protein
MHRKLVVAAAGTAAIMTVALGPAAYAAPAHPALGGRGVSCGAAALAAAVSSAYPGETLFLSPGCVYKLDDTIHVGKDLTIVGVGATLERASDSDSFSLIQVDTRGDLTVLYTNFRDGGGSGDNYGGAINAEHGRLDVHASNFEDNISAEYGGAIYVYKADVDVSDSTFTGNTADDEYGGAIYNDDGHLKVSGSGFADNNADDGGAIYNEDDTSLTGDTFRQNAADDGAAVYNDGDLTVRGSEMENNSAIEDGGGLYNDHCADASISGGEISGNHAGEKGGGIYGDNHPVRVVLHGTEVADNTPDDLANNTSAPACGV